VTALRDVVGVLDELYPPAWAESWDAVGLVCGDPDAEVRRVWFAVDCVDATVSEALDHGADLLVTHHPLLLRGVHGVPATTPKGRLVHRMVRGGLALHVAHTNADVASPGVSDALAARLGLRDVRPLVPGRVEPLDKVVVFVPRADAERLIDALAAAGAGALGNYSRCAWTADGTGTFRPGPGARPAIGRPGEVERVAETRVEMVLPRARRAEVVAALTAAHPYEEPAYDLLELAGPPPRHGSGRVGELAAPTTLAGLLALVDERLPRTVAGVRAAGDPARPVRRVAVCGGAGDGYLVEAARAGADAYLTGDLRHHPASEHLEAGGPALVVAAHWATERPWLDDAAARLAAALRAGQVPVGGYHDAGTPGDTVEIGVSDLVTDPWTLAAPPEGGVDRP